MSYQQKTKCDWGVVDWAKSDTALSLELGVSNERVRQMRIKLKQPESQNKNKPVAETGRDRALRFYSPELTIAQIADRAGVSYSVALSALRGRERKNGNRKYEWEAVDWAKLNTEIAAATGAHVVMVTRARQRFAPQHLKRSPYFGARGSL